MKPKDHKVVKIKQHASNLGYIKGSPRGSGHGGYFIENETGNLDKIRVSIENGEIVHVRDGEGDNYLVKDLRSDNKVDAHHVCPVKLDKARSRGFVDDLEDIISSIDTLPIDGVNVVDVFHDEEDAVDYFLMNAGHLGLESRDKFDKTLHEMFKNLFN